MAQIIIDTEKDDDRVLRAAVAFCNSITGDNTASVRERVGEVEREVTGPSLEEVQGYIRKRMAYGESPAFEDTEAPEPEEPSPQVEAPANLGGQPGSYDGVPVVEAPEPPAATSEGLDADGLPWDKRIHSSSKKKVADGTWRMRKKPKDMNEDEWNAFVEQVKGELKQAGSGEPIPAPTPAPQPEAPAPAPDAASAFGQQQQPAPSPQVEAPTPAPAPTGDGQSRTLAEVMQLVTGNPEKLNGDVLNGVLSNHGIASLGLVAAAEQQRPGIIATIYSELEAMVNG